MQCLVLLVLFSTFVAIQSHSFSPEDFEAWKAKHNKTYAIEENTQRFQNWLASLDEIEKLNGQSQSAVFGLTVLSDLSKSEFHQLLGYQQRPRDRKRNTETLSETASLPFVDASTANLPTVYNWCSEGYCSPIKNQGQCGSCWAYSTTSAVESAYAIALATPGNVIVLGPQYLIDCDNTNNSAAQCSSGAYYCGDGCNEGYIAFDFVEVNGHYLDSRYPETSNIEVTGVAGTCNTPIGSPDVSLAGYQDLSQKSELQIAADIAEYGPAVALVDATNWQNYVGGIMSATTCAGTEINHAITLVGYNTTEQSWEIRNSWGSSWGENGFIRIQFDANACLIQGEVLPLEATTGSKSGPSAGVGIQNPIGGG